jgi:hypothetical protein
MRLPTRERSVLRIHPAGARFRSVRPRSAILDPKSLLVIACMSGVAAFQAHAADYPKLKPGLWQMERAPEAAGEPASRATMCLDASVQKEMFDVSTGSMQGMCSKHDFRFSGSRGTGDFVCDMAGSRMHSKSTLVVDGDKAYRAEIVTTYDPPLMGRARTRTLLTAKHLGACKPGQRPGDLVMPNGQTMNVHDVLAGARRAQPGARPGNATPPRPAPQPSAQR